MTIILNAGPPCPPVPGPPLSPRPGAPSVPPSRADPGPPAGRTPKVKNVFRFKIDAKSIPEALATTILILQKFSIDLAHRQNPGASAHPDPSGTPHRHPTRTPSTPWAPADPPDSWVTVCRGGDPPRRGSPPLQICPPHFGRIVGWGGRKVTK